MEEVNLRKSLKHLSKETLIDMLVDVLLKKNMNTICKKCNHEFNEDELRWVVEGIYLCKTCFDKNFEDIGGIN